MAVSKWRSSASNQRWTKWAIRQTLRWLSTDSPDYPQRPSIAPKPVIDIKHIRENPELHSKNCLDRNYNAQSEYPFKIVQLFEERKALQQNTRNLRERNNHLQTQLSPPNHPGTGRHESIEAKPSILEEARQLKQQLSHHETQETNLTTTLTTLALSLPNLTSPHTPLGSTPLILTYLNPHLSPSPTPPSTPPKSHTTIGTHLSILDFHSAATTSGWGFYYLQRGGALLEQALIQYAIHTALRHGFTLTTPPTLTYTHIASACGFRPRDQGGEQQIYTLAQSAPDIAKGKPELALAGTAEIPFAGMKAGCEIAAGELPIKVVGASRCFRAEAGARGVDTRGLYRVHEFSKVEMFAWTGARVEAAEEVFEEMVGIQLEILGKLGLYCRALEQPSGDLGASAFRKRDVEAFFPGRWERNGGWGEVTSVSICTDYQTRRLGTRVREGGGKLGWPFTVNGTAMAVPRVLAAILEMGWVEEEGIVRVPEVLWPWMGGMKILEKRKD